MEDESKLEVILEWEKEMMENIRIEMEKSGGRKKKRQKGIRRKQEMLAEEE